MNNGNTKRGNCYVTSEALYHLLGGKAAGWKPKVMRIGDERHWFIENKDGRVIDATAKQFRHTPDYRTARGSGFLTKEPSKRARELMDKLLWNERD